MSKKHKKPKGKKSFSPTLKYDAVQATKKRAAPVADTRGEDKELRPRERDQLITAARDLARNYSVARWAIQKHLDFVSSFSFHPRTGNPGLDDQLSSLVETWSRKENFDVAGKHPRRRFLRLAEARRTVDGDILLVKLGSGHLQGIEGDRVRNPELRPDRDSGWSHGVKTDSWGRHLLYSIHRRVGTKGFEHERNVRASNAILHAYYDRFDQNRGVSPLASGINALIDSYRSIDYALAKAKVAQLFGLVVTREPAEEEPYGTSKVSNTQYEVDFNDGAVFLDLDPGDDAKFLENKTPPAEFQNFMQQVIGISLKALDIPYSFYQENFTNFFGSRAALLLYQKSARHKQADNRELLDALLEWKLLEWIAARKLPPGANYRWDWIAEGIPWWDPTKEVKSDLDSIAGNLRTHTEIRRERFGDDWKTAVVDKLAEERAYLAEKGLTVTSGATESAELVQTGSE